MTDYIMPKHMFVYRRDEGGYYCIDCGLALGDAPEVDDSDD